MIDAKYAGAFVRGLTFDGEKGLFVKKTSCAAVLALSDDELKATEEFKAFISAKGKFPETVSFMGQTFALGASFEEAAAGKGVSVKPVTGYSASRADVVRGKIALVTGGAQGFGEGMVRGLVREGAFCYIADMNEAGAKALADKLNAENGRHVAEGVAVNVTDEASVEAMIDAVVAETGALDIFINNAGVLKAGSVKEMTLKDFSFVTSVDYVGFFLCAKYAARMFEAQNKGNAAYLTDLIVISSKSGLEGSNKNGAYAGAKFGVIGLAQSFALELVKDGVKVNAVCPGNFLGGPLWSDPVRGLFVQYLNQGKVPGAKTIADVRAFYEGKVPMKRGCETEDVMRAILYIVEQKYETGQAVPVTGGQVMLN